MGRHSDSISDYKPDTPGACETDEWSLGSQALRARREQALGDGEQEVGHDHQCRHEHRTADDLADVALGKAVDEVAAQAAEAKDRGKGCRGEDLDGSGPDAGQDHGHRQRQLNARQQLALGQAQAAPRLDQVAIDTG